MSQAQGELFQEAEQAAANGHKIIIIDGHALAFRSYYAIRELTNSKGQSTNAIYGFMRSLLRILKEEGERDATVVTFDAPAKTFRHEQYEDYKAGRAPMPTDLPWQIEQIKKLVDLLGLYQIEVPGLEADDLIGTIATGCEAQGYHVEIVTSDRDAYQLISERVCVRGLDKKDTFTEKRVLEKYGVSIAQWIDYRALIGDSSDNIPGAKGIGPKTASKLLQAYGSLDYMLANLDDIKPDSARKKIVASLEDVHFSKELSRIVTDADIAIEPENWADRQMQAELLSAALNDLEFGSILRELNLSQAVSYQEVAWETLAAHEDAVLGYVLSSNIATTAQLEALALAHEGKVAQSQDSEAMKAVLTSRRRIDAVDAKALAVYAHGQGLRLEAGQDPQLMAYVLDPNTSQPEAIARRYGVGDWEANAKSRAIVTAELLKSLPLKLDAKPKAVYEEIEQPLQGVLATMECHGIKLDRAYLQQLSEALGEQIADLENQIRDIAENPLLNVNSRDQLAELLYDKLELQAGKKTATGKRSTAVSALEPLKEEHPVVGLILDYRELAKLKNTYLDPLPQLINPNTGRVHTTFAQTVAATGRLSSINPNLQNIPVRSDLGRQIRKGFIAEEGCKLLVADYSQIELRILAHIAGEEALIETFKQGEDIHQRTAAEVNNVSAEAVTPDMRRVAKIINFGVLYGMSAHRLSNELGIDYEEASVFIDTYFERYPKVRGYIDGTLDFARANGYVETLLGRRRYIPDIHAKSRNQREYAERTAYNMPIQGTQADIVKIAMINVAPKLEPFKARLLLQVHDELVIEAPEGVLTELSQVVKETMQEAYELDVPIVSEVGIGENWLEAK